MPSAGIIPNGRDRADPQRDRSENSPHRATPGDAPARSPLRAEGHKVGAAKQKQFSHAGEIHRLGAPQSADMVGGYHPHSNGPSDSSSGGCKDRVAIFLMIVAGFLLGLSLIRSAYLIGVNSRDKHDQFPPSIVYADPPAPIWQGVRP